MSMIVNRRRPLRRVPRPPGPSGASLLRAFTSRQPEASGDWFVRTARDYPRICYLYGGPRRHTYVVNHPDLVAEVLRTQGRVMRKGPPFQVMKVLFGEGMITSDEPLHKRQRALAQPAFHTRHVSRYAEQMAAAAAEHEETWQDGRRVEMVQEMLAVTLAVAGRTLFGSDLRGDVGEMGRSIGVALEGFRTFGYIPLGRKLLHAPLPMTRRTMAASRRVEGVVRRIVDERRAREAAGGTAPSAEPDLLELLMRPDEHGERMSDVQLRDEAVTILVAGHETTAMALSWTWYLFARHPEQADAVRAEVQAVVGDRLPGYADYGRLPRTRAAIAESMRLYPPAWGFSRTVLEDTTLDGWPVPAGSVCAISQWALHRDPRFWSEPTDFRPERWLTADGRFDESAPGQPRDAWLPFGMGSRICIGMSFAWTEAVLVLATLCRRWRPELAPGARVAPRGDVTLRPAYGMPMVLRDAKG
jgi:cytochrome P450